MRGDELRAEAIATLAAPIAAKSTATGASRKTFTVR
jgi:hypothetical protein